MKIIQTFRRAARHLSRLRVSQTVWASGAVGGIVFLCGILWQHPGLLGGGAVVLCLTFRTMGGAVTVSDKSSRAATTTLPRMAPPPTVDGDATPGSTIDSAQLINNDLVQELSQAGARCGTDSFIDLMLGMGRYALLLRPETSAHLSPQQLTRAVRMLDEAMALVPDGNVWLGQLAEQAGSGNNPDDVDPRVLKSGLGQVSALYLDRYTVTNAEYLKFVDDGGYERLEYWLEEALPALLDFVDQSGLPGPRFWYDGRYAPGEERLPVVGVSWYEACAYGRWVGKRLPTDAEWTKAGAWPVESAPGRIAQRRYPWGESFDVRRANLWGAGRREATAVDEFPGGCSVGGIHQLIGNVWEWTACTLSETVPPSFHVPNSMMSIRGGAFDTYFENQATCHYQSGELPWARRANIGFRLALPMSALEAATDPAVQCASQAKGPELVDLEETTAC